MPVTFENPAWLWTALLAAPMCWLGWRWLRTMSPLRRATAVVFRAVLIGLIACMLAGASALRTTDRVAVVAVIDASESVRSFASRFGDLPRDEKGRELSWDEAVRRWLDQARAGQGVDDLVGAVMFDGRPVALAAPMSGQFDVQFDQTGAQGTDIASALRFASALFPAGANRRIVLVSDGNQTTGDALAAAAELAADKVRVDVVPIRYNVRNEVIVESVDAPPQAAAGSTVRVRVVLEATDPATGTLELLYEGGQLDINGTLPGSGRRVTLEPGRNVEMIDVPLPDATVHRFEPVFVPDDPSVDQLLTNNRAQAFTVTPGKGRVLIVDGVSQAQPGGAGLTLLNTLTRAEIDARAVRPEDMPRDLLALNAYDLIVLQNVPADAVDRATQSAIAEYVNTLGGGLLMTGGPDAFGAGGWKGTPVEPILPVSLELPEQVMAIPAAVALVIDNSGSMTRGMLGSSRSKQQIANEGAALAVLALDKADGLVVIAFNSEPEVVIPPGRNKDPRRNADIVRSIGSGGGTNISDALVAAGHELAKLERAGVRHVILLTDGRDDGGRNLPAIAAQLKAQNITVSAIGVGDDVDVPVLSAIAQAGGGKFYNVTDPSVLPRVFVKEVRVVRKPLIRETPFIPRVAPGAALAEGLGAIPELGGLVLTQARPSAKATTAMLTAEGEPVLATWSSGRGRVTAFTSDAHNAWASRWVNWPGYSTFWTRLVRATSRPASESNSELTVQITGDTLRVRLDAAEKNGAPLDMLSVPGTVYQPDGTSVQIRLTQTGPGTYETSLPARETGNYIVALSPSSASRRLTPVIGGASVASGPETRRLRSNTAMLERIAAVTGGRVLDLARGSDADLFNRDTLTPTVASLPLWRTLLIWTIAVLVLDIGTRRLAWDRLLSREWRLAMHEQTQRRLTARAEQAAATIRSLKRAADKDHPAPRDRGVAGRAPVTPRPDQDANEDDDDRLRAERLEVESRRRQHALRAETLRARSTGVTPGGSDGPKTPEPSDSDARAEPTSELLKAKRRARERYDDRG